MKRFLLHITMILIISAISTPSAIAWNYGYYGEDSTMGEIARGMRFLEDATYSAKEIGVNVGDLAGFARSGGLLGENNQTSCSGSEEFIEYPDGRVIRSVRRGRCTTTSSRPGWGNVPFGH